MSTDPYAKGWIVNHFEFDQETLRSTEEITKKKLWNPRKLVLERDINNYRVSHLIKGGNSQEILDAIKSVKEDAIRMRKLFRFLDSSRQLHSKEHYLARFFLDMHLGKYPNWMSWKRMMEEPFQDLFSVLLSATEAAEKSVAARDSRASQTGRFAYILQYHWRHITKEEAVPSRNSRFSKFRVLCFSFAGHNLKEPRDLRRAAKAYEDTLPLVGEDVEK